MEIGWLDLLILGATALVISFFTSMSGVSGAFLLLPLQSFYFGIASPVISGTNHVYNLLATPGGIVRYGREGRILWSLALPLLTGSIPGVAAGAWIRIRWLPDAESFKFFAGLVLLAVALRLIWDIARAPVANRDPSALRIADVNVPFIPLMLFSAVVGIVGGAYGIGGGVFIIPLLLTVFRLPVRAIAGAALFCTFATSAIGAGAFQIFSLIPGISAAAPSWGIGAGLGLGGLVGTYLGARCQSYFPVKVIKGTLAVGLMVISFLYLAPGLA